MTDDKILEEKNRIINAMIHGDERNRIKPLVEIFEIKLGEKGNENLEPTEENLRNESLESLIDLFEECLTELGRRI